jgi:hypothetical protein
MNGLVVYVMKGTPNFSDRNNVKSCGPFCTTIHPLQPL